VRDRLTALGLQSFVKTSGGKGLHIVVPVQPDVDWDEVKTFTRRLRNNGQGEARPLCRHNGEACTPRSHFC
jgi:bifunctional non-homologous end joining protein LigD